VEKWRFKHVNRLRVTSMELKEFLCLVFTAFCVFLAASGKDGRLHAKKSPENGAWNWDPIYRHQPSSLASKHAHGHNHIICAAAGWAAVSACKPPCRISFYILVSLVQESTSSPRVDQQSYWCHLLFGVVALISRHTYGVVVATPWRG